MECKICKTQTKEIFETTVLRKYLVHYFQCPSCRFIQTEKPYWLTEAYGEAIADLDVGYITRNISFAEITSSIIKKCFNLKSKFLDYGGGYGVFVRLMRDKGFDFYRQDIFCKNIFASNFDLINLPVNSHFTLTTAFEVFEHLEEPIAEINKMFEYSDSILFSTELHSYDYKDSKEWWYFMPETGQHIAFYSKDTLLAIANKFNCNLYSNGKNLHLLTLKKYNLNYIKLISYSHYIINILTGRHFQNKKSLIQVDFAKIKKGIL